MAIKSLEDLTTVLSQHPQSAEILEFINASIEEERQLGIKLKGKANSEAHSLRRWKQAVEAAGYDAEDPEGIQAWVESKIKPVVSQTPEDGAPNPEIEKLRKEFAKAQKALDEERANAAKIKETADRRQIKAKLVEALRDKVYGHDLLADNLINGRQVKLADDESVVFVSGEDELEFDKGVKKLLESRPDLLKNTQVPGARSSSRPNSAAVKYSMEKIKSMTQEEIAADMENVKASLAAFKP